MDVHSMKKYECGNAETCEGCFKRPDQESIGKPKAKYEPIKRPRLAWKTGECAKNQASGECGGATTPVGVRPIRSWAEAHDRDRATNQRPSGANPIQQHPVHAGAH